jgi:hypothetical protein
LPREASSQNSAGLLVLIIAISVGGYFYGQQQFQAPPNYLAVNYLPPRYH